MDAEDSGRPERKEGARNIFCDRGPGEPRAGPAETGIQRRARNREPHVHAPGVRQYFANTAEVGTEPDTAADREHARSKVAALPPSLRHRSPAGICRGSG